MDTLIGSIWGPIYAMSLCVVCTGSNNPCWKCERKQLIKRIHSLEKELSHYYTADEEKLALTWYDKQLSTKFKTKYYTVPQQFDFSDKLSTSHFLTITFDPARFGIQFHEAERMQYIVSKFHNVMDKQLIKSVYGSFEYHNNGIIHTHAIIIAQQEDIPKIKQLLKSYFTDNPHNKIVIDLGPAKWPQGLNYINKISTKYYTITPITSSSSSFLPSKLKKVIAIDRDYDSSDEESSCDNPLDVIR